MDTGREVPWEVIAEMAAWITTILTIIMEDPTLITIESGIFAAGCRLERIFRRCLFTFHLPCRDTFQ